MTFRSLENRQFPRLFALMLLCYSIAIFACLAIRPLWVDEVIQLIATRSAPSVHDMFRSLRISVGAAPIGYLIQRPFVRAMGPSTFWARFPSALFSIASCYLLIRICGELKISRSATALACGILMIAPSQVRYAMEGRPYSEALFFGLLSILALVKLAREKSIGTAILAILAIAAGLYTQTYVIFAIGGAAAWYLRKTVLPMACVVGAAILFAPWYIMNSQLWHTHMRLSEYPNFHWTPALALDVVKGVSGGSLLCSAALLLLAAWSRQGLLVTASLFAIVGPLVVDSLQDYFFAARQILFAIPSLAILAALGFDALFRKNRIAATAALTLFAIAALKTDVTFQLNQKEDWRAAANAVAEVARDGYCIQPAVDLSGAVELYSVFVPSLASMTCGSSPNSKIAFVSILTMDQTQVHAAQEKLRGLGFVPQRTITTGGTTITLEEK